MKARDLALHVIDNPMLRVYTTNDNGNLVPIRSVEIVVQRDGGEATPILVMVREDAS